MKRAVVLRFALLCLGVLCASERRAAAQDDAIPELQPHGLFGSGVSKASSERLGVVGAVTQGFDSNVPPELQSRLNFSNPQSGGYSSIFLTAANYERRRRKFDLAGNFVTSTRYYGNLKGFANASASGGLGATLRLSPRLTLTLNETLAYTPSYLYRLFPAIGAPGVGDALPAAADYRLVETPSFAHGTTIRLAEGSARGTRLSFEAARDQVDFAQALEQRNVDIVAARGRVSHGVGRTGVISVELERRQGEFGYGAKTTEHRVKIGGEYSPALSLSRRLSVRFNIAPSKLDVPLTATNVVATGTLYKVEGETSVRYPFLYNWSLGGAYRRGVEYLDAIGHPVFSDALRLDTAGLITVRLDVSGSAAYLTGRSLLVDESQRLDSYTWRGRARYALRRNVALYGEYLYYHYDLRGQANLVPGVPPVFAEHGIRMGVMLWAQPVGR